MPFMPFNILGIWFRGFFSVGLLALGLYLLTRWYDESHVVEPVQPVAVATDVPRIDVPREVARDLVEQPVRPRALPTRRFFRFDPGLNRATALLAGSVALLVWTFVGRLIGSGVSLALRGASRAGAKAQPGQASDEPNYERGGEAHRVRGPDGSELQVECHGPADAPPLIFIHGWGANATEWYYPKKHLAGRFRLIVWDLPGLGLSKKPDDNDYRIDNLAADLEAVLTFAGDKPAVIVGHSIGGMIALTLCRLYPRALGHRVAGLVLVHTTYTNPIRTAGTASLYSALEKPLIVPLLYLTIALWPLVWLMNWMSYLNGSLHRSTAKSSFAGTETPAQVDFVARLMPEARPDVLARGMLGMIAYDATTTLHHISVPVLAVVGDLDATTTPEAGKFIADHVPKGELVTLSPAKHMGLIEHNGRFDQVLAAFAHSCLASSGAEAPPTVSRH